MPETTTEVTAYAFAAIARALHNAARTADLPPRLSFRSPPTEGLRTIRRRPNGRCIIAVAIRGRTLDDVAADLLAGALEAHGLTVRDPAGATFVAAVADCIERLR